MMFYLGEYVRRGLILGVILSIIIGFWLLLYLSRQTHRHSTVLSTVLALGFTHAIFYGLHCLKSSYDFDYLSYWILDLYAFPMLCSTAIFGLVVIFEIVERKSIQRNNRCYLTYALYILCFGAAMLKFRNTMGYYQNHNCFLLQTDLDFNPVVVYACENFDVELMCTFLEYLLLYMPYTVAMLTVKYGQSEQEISDLKLSTIQQKKTPGIKMHNCSLCCLYSITIRRIGIYLFIIMWFVRPIIIVLGVYFESKMQDYIPWSTMLVLYFSLICVFINQRHAFDKEDTDTFKCSESNRQDVEIKS